jgi:hypothetical protein
MPKIHEEIIQIKVYKLVKNDDQVDQVVGQDLLDALSSVVDQLTDDKSLIIEVEKI